jgi:hypothetical protein
MRPVYMIRVVTEGAQLVSCPPSGRIFSNRKGVAMRAVINGPSGMYSISGWSLVTYTVACSVLGKYGDCCEALDLRYLTSDQRLL